MLKNVYLVTSALLAGLFIRSVVRQDITSAVALGLVGLATAAGWWREYHKCPTCHSRNRAEIRVQVIDHPERWIPWTMDGGNRCPDPWHKHN